MRRVVVTGIGIVSCIGNNVEEVLESLKQGRSGISFNEEYQKLGLRSHVSGSVNKETLAMDQKIPRQARRFMGDAAAFAYIAMQQAIDDAKLTSADISNARTGIIAGSGGASTLNQVESVDLFREKGIKRVGPYRVTRTMGSTVSACLATSFEVKGVNYSISSACSTSAHCIGNAVEQIQLGKQDVMFAGGGEEEHWAMSILFDAMGALSSRYNDCADKASRAFDLNRDGFVIAGGGAILVLEELEHAKARGATIHGEIVGYGANSDGYNMVSPSGEGAVRCMRQALETVDGRVDYINAHGTSTPAGDTSECDSIKEVFGDKTPAISSTKSLTGHSLGATGAQEAIYTLLMMKHNFMTASANIETLDPAATGIDIVMARRDNQSVNIAMSNSFGFGGTNAALVFGRY